MASYTLEENGEAIEVVISGYDGPLEPVLESFRECQEGRCACPTDQYESLDALEVNVAGERIILRLVPKPGKELVRSEIERCLDYTLGNTGNTSH
jgi:hypothetical protein